MSSVIFSRPVAVEYRITPLGKTLRAPVEVILEWAVANMSQIVKAREDFDQDV